MILCGRLTSDPEIRYSQSQICTARYSLAVDRLYKKEGEPTADFVPCVSFGKAAEFAEKYFRKGMKVIIEGRWQTGSYTNKDGRKIYTNDCIVERQEFGESKNASQNNAEKNFQSVPEPAPGDEFMDIPDGIDSELPFN